MRARARLKVGVRGQVSPGVAGCLCGHEGADVRQVGDERHRAQVDGLAWLGLGLGLGLG